MLKNKNKIFFLIILLSAVLLSGCGKEQLPDVNEVFVQSLQNLKATNSNYALEVKANIDIGATSEGQAISLIKGNVQTTIEQNDKVSKTTNNSQIAIPFLEALGAVSDNELSVSYVDKLTNTTYENGTKEIKEKDEQSNVDIFAMIMECAIPTAIEEVVDSNNISFYHLAVQIDTNKLQEKANAIKAQSDNEIINMVDTSSVNISTEQPLIIDYFINKDNLLPVRVQSDITKVVNDSINALMQNKPEITEDSNNMLSFITLPEEISVNTLNFIVSFANYGQYNELTIPQDIISNAVEKQDGFNFDIDNENIDNEEDEEDDFDFQIEEVPPIEYSNIYFDEEITIGDSSFSVKNSYYTLEELGFEMDKEYVGQKLKPGTYSVDIKHYLPNSDDYFLISYFNDSDDTKEIEECNILSITLNASNIDNNIVYYGRDKLLFDYNEESIYNILGMETFKYDGDISKVYTYQEEDGSYIEAQFLDGKLYNLKILKKN